MGLQFGVGGEDGGDGFVVRGDEGVCRGRGAEEVVVEGGIYVDSSI